MPGIVSEGPSVALSFANNFWGKDDAGVDPLLQRMHNAKQTCDELKSFYSARASIEEEYARKLLSLSRKPLGSQEAGTLRASMDVLRGEVEQMGKSHQNIAGQMKTELEEPLAAFAGAMKERRKIVQNGIEKLLKVKVQQTQQVNKTRDRYEQECLKIKGYLAQGHMVMGQEERKNKAKLEKTQINLATSNTEYENAVKILEETTGRWNRDWKAAADKFQDLEEERLDFMKSSLWSFANIASTVCVSDDASCEKVRLSLENCEVEKDIVSFIKDRGTGQEIPDPPKYINFCRGDVSDTQSEASEDDSYSVAQFQRTINPAYRSSSPQPSTYESHHDPHSALVRDLGHDAATPNSREATVTPQKAVVDRSRQPQVEDHPETETPPQSAYQAQPRQPQNQNRSQRQLQLEDQPESRTQQQIGYQAQPRQSQSQNRTQSSRQLQLEDQPEPQVQPQQGYQAQPRQSQGHNRSQNSRQYQLEDRPEPQRQAQLAYQAQPRQPQSQNIPQNPRQLQLEDQPEPQVQPQIGYQAQARQSQGHNRSQSSRQLQIEHQPEPQTQQQIAYQAQPRQTQGQNRSQNSRQLPIEHQSQQAKVQYDQSQHGPLAPVPHDPYPMDGMTMLCRTGPPSERSSAHSPGARPSSRDSNSEYSNPTSFSSQEPPSGKTSPVKQVGPPAEKQVAKKKSGFFQSHSPFRRKSNKEKDHSTAVTPSNRNTWSARNTASSQASVSRRSQPYGENSKNMISDRPTGTPEPIDPRASFQLNVGNNVFDVDTQEKKGKMSQTNAQQQEEELDPIAQALAELKGVTKASSSRMSADNYHGIPTPAPGATPSSRTVGSQMANGALIAGMRGTPPPSYDQPIQRLGLPQPAFTSKAMQQTRQKYVDQTQNMFNTPSRPDSQGGYGSAPQSRPGTRGSDMPRATSPAPPRSVSPRPNMPVDTRQVYKSASPAPTRSASPKPTMSIDTRQAYRAPSPAPTHNTSPRPNMPVETRQAYRAASPAPTQTASPRTNIPVDTRQAYRSASPNPYAGSQRSRAVSITPQKQRESDQGYYLQNSPNELVIAASPTPFREQERPGSSHVGNDMSMQMQLAPASDDGSVYGSQGRRNGRSGGTITGRPMSLYGGQGGNQQLAARSRSKSVAEVRQYNREGRPILHFARAMYMYQAAIPEELSFAKGDVLAVLRLQDDGWWEAEVAGKNERPGLVPSNYLQNC